MKAGPHEIKGKTVELCFADDTLAEQVEEGSQLHAIGKSVRVLLEVTLAELTLSDRDSFTAVHSPCHAADL